MRKPNSRTAGVKRLFGSDRTGSGWSVGEAGLQDVKERFTDHDVLQLERETVIGRNELRASTLRQKSNRAETHESGGETSRRASERISKLGDSTRDREQSAHDYPLQGTVRDQIAGRTPSVGPSAGSERMARQLTGRPLWHLAG